MKTITIGDARDQLAEFVGNCNDDMVALLHAVAFAKTPVEYIDLYGDTHESWGPYMFAAGEDMHLSRRMTIEANWFAEKQEAYREDHRSR